MKKIIILLLSVFILWGIGVFASNCANEWEFTQRLWDNPKYCCNGLEWFLMPDLPIGIWVELLCHNPNKWTPVCKEGINKWRYYYNWTLLKPDVECKVNSCSQEWQTYNNWIDAQWPFACCAGLQWFTWWNIDGKFMPLCYNTSRWNPVCMQRWWIKWRYYADLGLLKSDSNCEIISNEKLDNAISWMYDNGLTMYNNANDFKVNNWLRRDEAAKFFVQFANLLWKTDHIKSDEQCIFSDINQSRSDLKGFAVESCKLWLFQWNKWKFYPKDKLTNAQAITVLIRLVDWLKNEIWLSHRSDNYYDKANELWILQNVNMNSKNNIATRWNVGIIIYNGKDKKSSCTGEWWIVYQNSYDVNGTQPIDCCVWLSYFEYRSPAASSAPMCYKESKWTPLCQQVWTSNEWRYYPDWTLLKKDNECSEYTL